MFSPRNTTVSVAPAATLIPFTPVTSTPACALRPSIVIDLVIVTPPNPPGSSTSISPPAAVFEIAPANVLHGAVRLHGLASSPTPETQVRVACALAGANGTARANSKPRSPQQILLNFIITSRIYKFTGLPPPSPISRRLFGATQNVSRTTQNIFFAQMNLNGGARDSTCLALAIGSCAQLIIAISISANRARTRSDLAPGGRTK